MLAKIKEFSLKYLWLWPLLVGLFARLYKITASSIWHDEGYTMWLLRYDVAGILERTARDVHPPGYYLLAKPWVEVLGNSIFSIRFFSLIFSLGIVYLVYRIVKDIWGEKSAFWASLFMALSPFMVHFGQEARMYGVVAFFTTLSTYFFVRMIKEKEYKYLLAYVPAMLIAMYTQYFAFFVIISHWVIFSIYTNGFWKLSWKKAIKEKVGILSWQWWLANISLLVGYAVWFPVAYSQVTRVSDSYWIQPDWITWRTIPNNILQFGLYSNLEDLFRWNQIVGGITWVLLVSAAVFGGLLIFRQKQLRKVNLCLYIFGFLPMILVFTMSKLSTPTYMDRYFPFAAVAIITIWALVVSEIKNKYIKYGLATWVILLFGMGNLIMHRNVNHQMQAMSEAVTARVEAGDVIYSGELYTYLDGAYYLGYEKVKFISKPVDGYGESSLFYDQQPEYVVSPDDARLPDRVFVIGKTGDKDYFKEENWPTHEAEIIFDEGNKTNGLKAVLYKR